MTDAHSFKGLSASTETFDGSDLRIAIVHGRWNSVIIEALVKGAMASLEAAGVKKENIHIENVSGSYELPFACQRLISGSQIQNTELIGPTATSLLDSPQPGSTSGTSTPARQASQSQSGQRRPFDAIIPIGTLLKGSTMHFEYICDAVSHALMRVGLDTGVPVIFGILTCLSEEQALQRAGVKPGSHNHGEDWGKAAVEMACKNKRWSTGV